MKYFDVRYSTFNVRYLKLPHHFCLRCILMSGWGRRDSVILQIIMTKKELIKRWETIDGQLLQAKILNCLKKSTPLSSINGLTKHEGRWDIRGAVLSHIEHEREINAEGHSLVMKTGSLKLKNIEIDSVDFSFCDISYSHWQKCRIEKCLFSGVKAKEIKLIACDIEDCEFIKSELSYAYLNQNISSNSGSYIRTIFKDTNLSESIFYFPIIKDCVFDNCKLNATNFDGSRFQKTKFIGKVDSPMFNGRSLYADTSILGIFNRVDPRRYPNLMEDVDFTQATLVGVTFKNGINLSNCKFPEDENCLVLKNIKQAFGKAKEKINSNWTGVDKRIGLYIIDNVYYTNEYRDQDIRVIDKYVLTDLFGEKFSNIFFELMKEINTCR